MGLRRYIKNKLDIYLEVFLEDYCKRKIHEFYQNNVIKEECPETSFVSLFNKAEMSKFIIKRLLAIDDGEYYSISEPSGEKKHMIDAMFEKSIHHFGGTGRGTRLGDMLRDTMYENIPELNFIPNNARWGSKISDKALMQSPSSITESTIGDYTYGAIYSHISMTDIGKFCSIGPNLLCGWGLHPTNGISTAPMFYSTMKQNGTTLSETNKVVERKRITIGNDVFIGANVTILDGVTIGDGAIIGAGAVINKDIPPYAVAVGCPVRIVKYRFPEDIIEKLLEIQWWNFSEEHLKQVEEQFFDVESFVKECGK